MHDSLVALITGDQRSQCYHNKCKVKQENRKFCFVGFVFDNLIGQNGDEVGKEELEPFCFVDQRTCRLCTVIILDKRCHPDGDTEQEHHQYSHFH